MGGYQLSVDLGTSNTVAVLAGPDGVHHPLLFDGEEFMPSATCLDNAPHLLAGRDALALGQSFPDRLAAYPKRCVDTGGVVLGGVECPVTDLYAAVLARVAAEARRVAGEPMSTVTLSHPACWDRRQQQTLTRAAAKIGLGPTRLVPEPVAAALHVVDSGVLDVPDGMSLIVYDLGAGTFDAAVVCRTGATFEVLAQRGLPDAGGLDLDAAIVRHLGAVLADDTIRWERLTRPQTVEDWRAGRRLLDAVRAAKELLSVAESTTIQVPLFEESVLLDRKDLEKVARPLLDRTVEATCGAITEAGIMAEEVAGVLLIGGASRIPLVSRLLRDRLGFEPTLDRRPTLAVADGCLPVRPRNAARRPRRATAATVSAAAASRAAAAAAASNAASEDAAPVADAAAVADAADVPPTAAPPVSAPPVSSPPVFTPPVSGPSPFAPAAGPSPFAPAGGPSHFVPTAGPSPFAPSSVGVPSAAAPVDAASPVASPADVPSAAAPPVSAPPVSAPPVSAPPVSGPPVSAPPVSGPPVSGPPVSGPPVSALPVSGPPAADEVADAVVDAEPEAAEPPEPEPPRVPHPASRAHASAVSHVTDAEPEPPVEQPPPVAHPASAARASAADHSPGARRRTYGRHPGSGRQRASAPQAATAPGDSWDPHETPPPDEAPQDSWGSPEGEHWDPRTTPDQYAAAPPHDWGAAPGHQEPWDPHPASARHEAWDPRDAAPHAAHAPQEAWHQQEAWDSQETFVPHEAWTTYPATGSPEPPASAPPQAPWVDPHQHPTGASRQASAWPWSEPAFGQAPAPATTAPRKAPKVRRKPANITPGSTRSKAVRAAKITAGTLTGAVVAIATGVWVGFAVAPSDQLPTIQVGQCVRQDGAQARRVDCTEPDAYTVTARVFPAGSCPDPAQPYAMQEQTQLCLAPAAGKPAGPKPAAPPTRRYGP